METTQQDMSIVTELIKEVESYLPDMNGILHASATEKTSRNDSDVKELHRMTHTIKGAAAMVQLEELSKAAGLMEDALDEIIHAKQDLSGELAKAMGRSIDLIGSYCSSLLQDEADGPALYRAVCEAFESAGSSFTPNNLQSEDSDLIKEDLFALLGDDEEETSTDDFFKQLEDEEAKSDNELEMLLESVADDTGESGANVLLVDECDESPAVEPDAADEDAPSLPFSAIDPELQDSFNEEAEEHLDNIGRQLNELSSSVTGPCLINDEYREHLHSILRSVHTLKGAAAVIGIEPVAAWGHDFEDFLDALHDDSETLSPETLSAMQDGADILEKIVADPGVDVSTEISALQFTFPAIMADTADSGKAAPEDNAPPAADKEQATEPPSSVDTPEDKDEQIHEEAAHQNTADSGVENQTAALEWEEDRVPLWKPREKATAEQALPIRLTGFKEKRKQTRKRTLRVRSEKIAELMGLSGDMAINLSSFESSASSMQDGMAELEMTLNRLKGIASSLEAGYELASIPHLGTAPGGDQDANAIMDEFDPLEMDRYSELHILIRSLNEAIVDLESIREQTLEVQNSWRLAIDRQRRVADDVQGAVQSIQMTPFSTLANRLYRTVRESARATGKNVQLLIEGGAMEMDTHVWDVLADALMHMLRNCVDHGVESADERQRAGKPEKATILIKCSRKGGRFVLRLSDDGGGLDYEAIRNRALTLYPDKDVERMDKKELAALIFRQGFSIRSKATSLSGRGVGMDVVRDAVDQLNGHIEVSSSLGQGTDFILSMPIVVAQLPALMVLFGKDQFAVPMRDVSRVIRLSAEERRGETIRLNDESFPLLRPAELLRLKNSADSTATGGPLQGASLALAVEVGNRRGVIVTDAVIGQKNVVFKGLGSHLQKTPCVSGATILGDGSLIPILQTEEMFTLAETTPRQGDDHILESDSEDRKVEILIADDSISIRKVLGNFITAQGYHSTAAVDGVDALEKIRSNRPDLILLDIEMPRMNGFEVLQTLQSQSAYRQIPVLMLTSRSAEKYREKATALGARGFVTKPFKDDELISLISELTAPKTEELIGE